MSEEVVRNLDALVGSPPANGRGGGTSVGIEHANLIIDLLARTSHADAEVAWNGQ
jgi:hypothetical protein